MIENIKKTALYKGSRLLCIMVEHGLRKEIMEKLGTTYPTVKKALIYQSNTELAEKVRYYALTHGGVLVEKRYW